MCGAVRMASTFGPLTAKTVGKDTGWGVAVKEWKTKRGQGPSGVCLPEPVLDEFVVMRLAELVDEGKVSGTIRRALKKWAGNGGALSLAYHAEAEWRMLTPWTC